MPGGITWPGITGISTSRSSDDGRTVAAAEVIISEQPCGTARVSLRAESGHITPGRRASLVDAVLDLPAGAGKRAPGGGIPARRWRVAAATSAALVPRGVSALLDARLPPGRPGSTARSHRPGTLYVMIRSAVGQQRISAGLGLGAHMTLPWARTAAAPDTASDPHYRVRHQRRPDCGVKSSRVRRPAGTIRARSPVGDLVFVEPGKGGR